MRNSHRNQHETNLDHLPMQDANTLAFFKLFQLACEKCFAHPLTEPLSETNSKILSAEIFEKTGLTIGVKSIRNYSLYILDPAGSKKENPSIATLDTFARYVLGAPVTDEVKRKDNESHHPYWHQFRNNVLQKHNGPTNTPVAKSRPKIIIPLVLFVIAIVVYLIVLRRDDASFRINENFDVVSDQELTQHGWQIRAKDQKWWTKKNEKEGHLTLFTLQGDNWEPSASRKPLQNLVLHEISGECFNTEIHFSNFVPGKNWQQAGMLLAEDSTLQGKVIRISMSYNNFFGGYEKAPEIIFQGLSSTETTGAGKPEEFAHVPIFTLDDQQDLVTKNLAKTILKIEKRKNSFRFLLATGSGDLFAFKEISRGDFAINPTYVGIFATEGISTSNEPLPVAIDSFLFEKSICND